MARFNPARPSDPLGWPLLPVPDADGSLNWPDLNGSIRETIRAILVTRRGERLLERRLGGGLQDFIHQPNTVLTRRRIHDRVAETLGLWEPRVELNDLQIEAEGDFNERVRITLNYRIRLTRQLDGISVALNLGGSE
ncbi:MAG: GPW/gp25 family protein [Aliishimia sp.]